MAVKKKIRAFHGARIIPLMKDALHYKCFVPGYLANEEFHRVLNGSQRLDVFELCNVSMAAMYLGKKQIAWVVKLPKNKQWRFTARKFRHQGIYHLLAKRLNIDPKKPLYSGQW